ncbi:hypothetical protein A3H11_00135 [Candidatus Uhrbacteria bacterium RIFCSPLOWO2_12_FULL_47_10]|nr:MAG: hypothetical protein A3H11_00135 [Candidatus Uhrbacteria bacterium RIFCSPLOWO2_12_FULL_47_10]
MFERFTRPPKESPVGTYRLEVISLPEECDWEKYLPLEIRYIFARDAAYKEKIRAILKQGKAIGVRTVKRTPENILKAVHTISVHSQGNYIVTWLPKLLRDKHLPHITSEDRARAKEHGEDLDQAVETIVRDRLRFKRLVLIDEENIGIKPEEQRFMTELSEIIYPLAIDYSVFRVIADNARERTKVAQAIIKALLIVGPIAHVLEKFAAGIGKVFAASADDLLGESAELMALRGSGFTWRELAKRSRILVPVFALATWGAFSVEGLLDEGHIIWGGVVFGLSAVALSLTTAVQSIFMYKRNARKLIRDGKVVLATGQSVNRIAIIQDFTNPARLGLLIGAALAPIAGIGGSLLGLMHNGWVLAGIGSTESIVAGLTVVFADYINEWRFHRKLQLAVKRIG